MASFNNHDEVSSATKMLVLPITGGLGSEPANKKQKKEAQRRVQHVGVQGPFIKSKWSHIPITFSQEDLQLKDYPHNDAMVISCVIKGFLVHNVLVDTGSTADIIFAKAFRQHSAKSQCQLPSTLFITQEQNRSSLTLLTWNILTMQSLVVEH
jgi:hypothetical protein